MTYEKIKQRYVKNYVTDDQLARFVALGVITEKQAETIKCQKMDGGGVLKPYLKITLSDGREVAVYE